jgi:hypothetical protein
VYFLICIRSGGTNESSHPPFEVKELLSCLVTTGLPLELFKTRVVSSSESTSTLVSGSSWLGMVSGSSQVSLNQASFSPLSEAVSQPHSLAK